MNGGLERIINVYTLDGKLIATYEGKVDIDDLTRLRRYNAEASTVIFPGADANGDGKVDIDDLTLLRKFIAEEAVVLGK